MSIIKKIFRRLDWLFNVYIIKHPMYLSHIQWKKDNGEQKLRFNYPLTEESIIFDVGGYKGEWSRKMVELYNSNIFIFEPVPEYCRMIKEKLGHNPKIKIFEYGLWNITTKAQLSIVGEGSTLFGQKDASIEVDLKDINEFLLEHQITVIDLIKINIEGAEYNLLNRMIEKNRIEICKNITIQFHYHSVANPSQSREEIKRSIKHTHYPTYEYPFVWENWRKK